MIRLPLLFRRPRNPLWYLVLWVPYIAIYQLTNRFPLFEPHQLPMTVVDRAVPFVPALMPLYLAYLPFYWWTGARSEDDKTANRLFYASYFQMLVCLPVFVLFPVHMPRELFYGPQAMSWTDGFWNWFDGPGNCLPSLHASNCLLFMRFNRARPAPFIHGALALAIIASTLLVKQHYAVDLAAGLLVYTATAKFLRRVEIVGKERAPSAEDSTPIRVQDRPAALSWHHSSARAAVSAQDQGRGAYRAPAVDPVSSPRDTST